MGHRVIGATTPRFLEVQPYKCIHNSERTEDEVETVFIFIKRHVCLYTAIEERAENLNDLRRCLAIMEGNRVPAASIISIVISRNVHFSTDT